MTDTVIRVENLGKQYRLGQRKRYNSLRESLVEALKPPLRRFRSRSALASASGHRVNGEAAAPDTFWALKDVSFEVKQGEVVGIIGRNGAGKSTLLKILSRITEPTEGQVELTGRVGSLLEVGTGFHPELTGRENVYLNGAILGMRREEISRKFDEIVAFAEVEKFIDTPVKHYSSGMYMRLAFSLAAHLEPEILVVDEVLAVGDLEFQKRCLQAMGTVASHGRTVLFVSHNMGAVQTLCHRGFHLDQGLIVNEGPADEVIKGYRLALQTRLQLNRESEVHFGDALRLTQLRLTPNPVQSGSDVDLFIEFRSAISIRIYEVALILFSAAGSRVAIIDMRTEQGFYQLPDGGALQLTGMIKGLPLVEGDYSVGIFINAGEGGDWGVRQDLMDLHVTAREPRVGFTPYNARVRGVVELETEFLSRIL
jgi:lipopolysaccharide transport system ATP-binding protein